MLWVVKDNAASQDRGWVGVTKTGHLHNNVWNVRNSSAQESFDTTVFTTEELRSARLLAFKKADSIGSRNGAALLKEKSLRFQRMMYFIQITRGASDVAMKVAQYCSGLEALLSSSSMELTHQVAERAACLLEDPGDARLDCFRKVKIAYGFRSKAVHGASFRQKDLDRLVQSSVEIDEICRKLIVLYLDRDTKIAENLEVDAERLNEFFHRRLLCSVFYRSHAPSAPNVRPHRSYRANP
jgi:hypothetical protein